MVTKNNSRGNDKANSYSNSEIEGKYNTIAQVYANFAEERYGIRFSIPGLVIIKKEVNDGLSSTVAFYEFNSKKINVNIDVVSNSKGDKESVLVNLLSHELGHALADQLGMVLDKSTLNGKVGTELIANILAAQVRAKIKGKPSTGEEIAKELLVSDIANLSYLKHEKAQILNKYLKSAVASLNEDFRNLNNLYDNSIDGLNLAGKGAGVKGYYKIKEDYMDKYTAFYKDHALKISSVTTVLDIYTFLRIGAARALVNGLSPDEVIDSAYKGKLFKMPEFKNYEQAAKAGMGIEDLMSYGLVNLMDNISNDVNNLNSKIKDTVSKYDEALSKIIREAADATPENLDNINSLSKNLKSIDLEKSLLELYKSDYHSMVKKAKRKISQMEKLVDETIEIEEEALKDLNEIRSKLYPHPVKSMERQ